MARTENDEQRPPRPRLGNALGIALSLALAIAAFVVELVGEPTWPIRIGAVAFVLAIGLGVVIWHLGFRAGAEWPDG